MPSPPVLRSLRPTVGVQGKPLRSETMPLVCHPLRRLPVTPVSDLAEWNLVDIVDDGVVGEIERSPGSRTGSVERYLSHRAFVSTVLAISVCFAVGVRNPEAQTAGKRRSSLVCSP